MSWYVLLRVDSNGFADDVVGQQFRFEDLLN